MFICEFKHVLNTKKLLQDEGPMCAIARLIEAQGPVGMQNECYLILITAYSKKEKDLSAAGVRKKLQIIIVHYWTHHI